MITRVLFTLFLTLWLAGAPAAPAADLAAFETADQLWAHIESFEKGPTGHPASREDMPRFYGAWFDEFEAALRAFQERHPADPRRWGARLHQLRVGVLRDGMTGGEPDLGRLKTGLAEVVQGKDVPEAIRAEATFGWLQARSQLPAEHATPAARAALDADLEAFCKAHPDDARSVMLRFVQAELWERADPARAEKHLQDLTKSEHEPLAAAARKKLALLALRKAPLDLKFSTLDGKEFDLAQWRGKVVLIDFWATWCGPCIQDLPNVVRAYEKYHAKGFEIVGISLDQNRAKLESVLESKNLAWPQYFDGKGWENELSRRFGITQIPTQWLVDKKGYLRHTEVRGGLDAAVAELLAE